MNLTTEKVVAKVINTAKKVAKRQTQRFPEAASTGDCFRQGDVYVTLLEAVPDGAKRQKRWDTQMAPGTTQGSRHVLDSKSGVECFAIAGATEFDGPVLLVKQERELTHPEHGNVILPPGVYAITYQRTQDALDRQQRVLD